MLKIEPSGIVGRFCSIVAVIMTIYHLWAINFGYFEPYLLNVTHIAFVFTLSFFLYATWGKKKHKYELLIDAILTILGLSSSMYIYINYYTMVFQRRTVLPNDVDIFFSLLGMVLLLELTRRAVGLPLFFIALIFIGYVFLGQYIPGPLHHGGFDLDRIVSLLYLSYEGMLGTILTVITSIVMMFIIFSATLREFGGGKFVTDAAFSLTGHMDGGPAKVAVVASAAFGTISGSAVSNVVATGTFTIPMMKKLGYKPHFAGAVEAAASTGGQIMPPIMGAAAFIMAEMTATPYHIIAFLAIIPAIYYFLCIFLSVHFEAKKLGLRGLSKKELPNIWNVIKWGGHLLPPFIFLVYLIYTGYPIKRAAFYCIILLIIFSLLRKTTRPSLKNFYNAFKTASYEILMISIACSAAGAVMGVLNLTGVGIRLAIFLIELSGNNLVLLLLMTAIVCIILGMGVPPVAAYAIPAAIMAPALEMLGVPKLIAHLYVFYFSQLAPITPPVALAAYAGAGIAGANIMRTAVTASRLGFPAFIIPWIFVFDNSMLLMGSPLNILLRLLFTFVLVIAFSIAHIGYGLRPLRYFERIPLFITTVLMILPDITYNLIGIVIFSIMMFIQMKIK